MRPILEIIVDFEEGVGVAVARPSTRSRSTPRSRQSTPKGTRRAPFELNYGPRLLDRDRPLSAQSLARKWTSASAAATRGMAGRGGVAGTRSRGRCPQQRAPRRHDDEGDAGLSVAPLKNGPRGAALVRPERSTLPAGPRGLTAKSCNTRHSAAALWALWTRGAGPLRDEPRRATYPGKHR